jgi:hypothetical protein
VNKDNCLSRSELDARNSDSRPPTFEEVVAAKFNDPTFNPTSLVLADLHEDFSKEIRLLYTSAPIPVTPDKIKDHLADTRAKCTLV